MDEAVDWRLRLATSLRQKLHETQARSAAAVARPQLELVRDRTDDGDPEPALHEVVAGLVRTRVAEPCAVVDDLDREPVVVQLVEDLDGALPALVGMPNGVGAGFGERELQVGERLLAERPQAREPRQGQATQRDVLRLGGDRPPDRARGRLPR